MKRFILVLAAALLFNFGALTAVSAQVENATVEVDGLACPFCAYGLEKRLKDIEGVGKVEIKVDTGVATLRSKKEKSIDVESLEAAVSRAGFTPRDVTVTAVGQISTADGNLVFHVSGADVQFLVKEDEASRNMQTAMTGSEGRFRVTGRLIRENPKGHQAHPYTLVVDKFDVIKESSS